MYTQCKIQYEDKGIGTFWIPDTFAKKHQNLVIGKDKKTGEKAKVLEVYGKTDVDMSKEQKHRTWSNNI